MGAEENKKTVRVSLQSENDPKGLSGKDMQSKIKKLDIYIERVNGRIKQYDSKIKALLEQGDKDKTLFEMGLKNYNLKPNREAKI